MLQQRLTHPFSPAAPWIPALRSQMLGLSLLASLTGDRACCSVIMAAHSTNHWISVFTRLHWEVIALHVISRFKCVYLLHMANSPQWTASHPHSCSWIWNSTSFLLLLSDLWPWLQAMFSWPALLQAWVCSESHPSFSRWFTVGNWD